MDVDKLNLNFSDKRQIDRDLSNIACQQKALAREGRTFAIAPQNQRIEIATLNTLGLRALRIIVESKTRVPANLQMTLYVQAQHRDVKGDMVLAFNIADGYNFLYEFPTPYTHIYAVNINYAGDLDVRVSWFCVPYIYGE